MNLVTVIKTSTISSNNGELLELCILPIDSVTYRPYNKFMPLEIIIYRSAFRRTRLLSKHHILAEPKEQLIPKEKAASDLKAFFEYINSQGELFNLVAFNLPYVQDFIRDLLGDTYYYNNFGKYHLDMLSLYSFFKKDKHTGNSLKQMCRAVKSYDRTMLDKCYAISKLLIRCNQLKHGFIDEE